MKSTIKTVQPYKLYLKLLDAKKSVKRGLVFALVVIIAVGFYKPPFVWMLTVIILILFSPATIYNPSLKKRYEPGKSYLWVKETAEGKFANVFRKMFPIAGFVGGALLDIVKIGFPLFSILLGAFGLAMAILLKKIPFEVQNQAFQLQRLKHQNVDYNVKVDLNDIYGINDKMIISYQNFHFDQKKLEKGDYLLGVSPLGIYFAHKSNSVSKTFIKFGDIDALGLLFAIGEKFIFNIKSKNNIEINIIIEDNSLVVSPYKLFDTLLNTLDSYILNGGVVSTPTSRRRRITVSPSSTNSTINKTEDVVTDTGRSIELDTTKEGTTDKQSTNTNRVVDISFTETVIAELAAGEMITSNRQIEI